MAYTDRITLQEVKFMSGLRVALRAAYLISQTFQQKPTTRINIPADIPRSPCDDCAEKKTCNEPCKHFEKYLQGKRSWSKELRTNGCIKRCG